MNKILVMLQILSILCTSCNSQSNESVSEDSAAVIVDTSIAIPISSDAVHSLFELSDSLPTLMVGTKIGDKFIPQHGSYIEGMTMMNDWESAGAVFIEWKQFSGNNIPFVCYVSKNIKSFYLDGKKIQFTPDKEFFFRQFVDLYGGYNRIPVKLINRDEKVLNTYIEINMERISK